MTGEVKKNLLGHLKDFALSFTKNEMPKAGKALGKFDTYSNTALYGVDCYQTYEEDKVYGVKKEVTMQKLAYKSAKFGIESTLDAMAIKQYK